MSAMATDTPAKTASRAYQTHDPRLGRSSFGNHGVVLTFLLLGYGGELVSVAVESQDHPNLSFGFANLLDALKLELVVGRDIGELQHDAAAV
jgi:hypothetical protein